MNRRTAIKILAGGSASVLARRPPWALGEKDSDDFFIFVHAAGGWDVMLWADPRNERTGLIEPPSTGNTDVSGLRHWKSTTLEGELDTFEVLAPGDTNLRFGPAIGGLFDLRQRLTVINGLEMNTVSHPDGVAYSVTGRHLTGGHPTQPSIDVVLANELGIKQTIPAASIGFPSSFVGSIDQRAMPLRMSNAASFAKSLVRSDAYLSTTDRDEIAALLTEEGRAMASKSSGSADIGSLTEQINAQHALVGEDMAKAFDAKSLQRKYTMFDYTTRSFGQAALAAPFAIEAMRRNLVRCVSFSLGGLDTHNDNYRRHGLILQDLFDVIATLLKQLESIDHPTRRGTKLLERTHLLVVSDFCRTPQITITGGRDHYPNNSALIVSPRFKSGRSFGTTDTEQLLPSSQAARSLTPADLIATFLAAFGLDPKHYMRDGHVDDTMLV